MKIKTEVEFQTFNDGVCKVYTAQNIAEAGNKPKQKLILKFDRVPYERRRVGVGRYYTAKQENAQIEELLRIPEQFKVSREDIFVVKGKVYGIEQIQGIRDVTPPACDVALKRLEINYDIEGIPG